MKAVYQNAFGPPDVLTFGDLPDPTPGPGEIVVKVRATSVNPLDCKLRAGNLAFLQGKKFPKIYGCDASGEVIAVGPGVTTLKVGDEVAGLIDEMSGKPGANAELAVAGADRFRAKPAGVSHAEAAASVCTGITALLAMKKLGGVTTGKKVLINGASGGVGTFAVQIAKILGGHVTAVCSAANADLVRSLGADDVIDYKARDFRTSGGPYDVVFDAINNAPYPQCRKVIGKGGVYVTTMPGPANLFWKFILRKRVELVEAMKAVDALPEVLALVESKKLKVVIDKTVALADLKEAHQLSDSGRVRGKIVVSVA